MLGLAVLSPQSAMIMLLFERPVRSFNGGSFLVQLSRDSAVFVSEPFFY